MEEQFVFNGVNAVTGDYLSSPVRPEDFPVPSLSVVDEPDHRAELQWRVRQSNDATFAPIEGINPCDLASAGWGIVFPDVQDPRVEAALSPLIDHRRATAGRRFQRLVYRPGESKQEFLSRHRAGPGPADPDRVPYYLLLVGSPQEIPFRFQYQLDVQYAIGRIYFEDPSDYAAYACGVVAAETSTIARPARATFFGSASPGDQATLLSSSQLVQPLAASFSELTSPLTVSSIIGELATKDRLRKILSDAPTLLFTATHGVAFPPGHPAQRQRQGALLCQDWPGPSSGEIDPAWYFAGEDVDPETDLTGMIAFHFACYSAGTPELDDYAHRRGRDPERIAPASFLAGLPRALLANPGGAALAVIGHIDRAWGYSFSWPDVGSETAVYASCLRRLVNRHPVASALEYFNDRYAELSSDLTVELEDVRYGKVPDALALAAMWTANNDARAFTLVGDPAVTLIQPLEAPGDPPVSGVPTTVSTREPSHSEPAVVEPDEQQQSLADRLALVLTQLGELDVVTSEGSLDPSSGADGRPLLRTRLSLTGASAETTVASGLDRLDGQLRRLHSATVDQAIAARGELLRNLPSVLAALRVPEPQAQDEGKEP
jgi:hypothetical protein